MANSLHKASPLFLFRSEVGSNLGIFSRLSDIFTAQARSRLRSRIRGYAWSERNEGFVVVRELKNSLTNVRVLDVDTGEPWFFGASAASVELLVRQFIYERYGGVSLNRALYQSWGDRKPISLAMPSVWQDRLDARGWKVNRIASMLRWQCVVLTRMCHGLLVATRLVVLLWRTVVDRSVDSSTRPHVVFESLTPANLPLVQAKQDGFDICSFYARWSGRDRSVRAICHNVPDERVRYAGDLPVFYRPPVYQLAAGRLNALRLAAWTITALLFSVLKCLCGRWEYALLLAEAVKARSVLLCNPECLAKEYLFHSSGTIYRPMWTYEAERHGADISLYFYSAYDQPKLTRGYEPQRFEWGPANWPRYIVWDAYQESVLKRDLGPDIQIAYSGAVYFSDSDQPLPSLLPRSVAVFDIQPHRLSAHFGISTLADCMAAHHDFCHRFLEDVAEVVLACGAHMALKGKRDIGVRGNKRYKRMVDALSRQEGVQVLAPDISAMRLIPACSAGISVPFTSTAIYLRDMGVPSIYYDPYGWMQRDDAGARGMPIVQGKADLRKWLEQVLNADVCVARR